MDRVARCLGTLGAIPWGCALAALYSSPVQASDRRIFTPDTLEVTGDVRFVGIGGEKSWIEGGFGKPNPSPKPKPGKPGGPKGGGGDGGDGGGGGGE